MEESRTTCKLRFNWLLAGLVLREKTLSDVGAMAVEVAGAPVESKEVFIVHGYSETAKTQLKSLLMALGLQPFILAEQTHRGRTIMEELEYYSTTCSFAIVLLTADDLAGEVGASSLRRGAPECGP